MSVKLYVTCNMVPFTQDLSTLRFVENLKGNVQIMITVTQTLKLGVTPDS